MAFGTDTYPFDFEVNRESGDQIRLKPRNEDGSGAGCDVVLTHAVAVELLRDLSSAVAESPFGR